MATELRFRRRSAGGAAGAPAALKTAEPAYNMADGKVYLGFGDDGGGNATSVKVFAKDDFIANVPAGGSTGQALIKNSNAAGDWTWGTVASGGSTYFASGDGIELNDVTFSLNYTQIATGLSLSNYATTSSLTSGLAGKLNLTGGTLTGGLVTAASASGGAGLNVPHGAAPSAPVNGDIWTTTTALSLRLNGATKTVAFTDSNITGSAATLTTGRTISTTGDVTYTSSSFNGSGNVTGTATIANSAVTLAKMANLAANSIIGNNTGSATAPIALTAAQVKTLLAVNFTDLSGTATAGQIPALDTAKITTGTFDAARIPNLDAAKITTGVFDVARIPILPSQTVQVSSGGIGDLTGGQQTNIEKGTVVTTTDGRRWVYNTGSKTSEASYVELADITPEWTSVANKPSFATVATSGSYDDLTNRPALATVATSGSYLDLTNRPSFATVATSGAYNDLTGKPTLGTMAAQNAASVAITGGTIDGVTLDGGTF